MDSISRRFAVFGVNLVVTVASAHAQTHTFDLRLAELDERGRITYQNFIYAYTPGGRLLLDANHLRLPRADYHETSVGAGYRVASSDAGAAYLIGHVGRGSDEQTYLQPAILAYYQSARRWSVAGFAMHYVPLTDDGPSQWLLDPVEVQYQLVGNVLVGLSAYYWRPQGGPHVLKAGGQVGIKLGRITPLIAVRQVNDPSGLQVQLRLLAAF